MPSSNCTITVLPDVLTFVHIPRSRLRQFSHYLVKQILTPAPSFLNITCNKNDLLLFAHYSVLSDFEPFARRDRQRYRKFNRASLGSHTTGNGSGRPSLSINTLDGIELSYDTWNVLQLDSHNDRLDNAGARIRELSAILAEAGISIMYQSSYTSDFIFVKSSRLTQVLACLAQAGFVGYSFENISPSLNNVVPLTRDNDILAPPGLIFEHNPNLMRSPSSDAETILSSNLYSCYNSRTMLNEVDILNQDLICVGLPEAFTDMWSLKIIKLIVYPELILASACTSLWDSSGMNIPDNSNSLDLSSTSIGGFNGNHLSGLDVARSRQDSWISPPVSPSLSHNGDLSSRSENEFSPSTTPVFNKKSSSPLQYSRSLPEISSFGEHFFRRIQRNLLEEAKSTAANDPSPSFFSFTRTAEGSSLTTSRKHIAALFCPNERHVIICGDELDIEEGNGSNGFPESESSEDLAIMKCLQLDIQRFGGDRHDHYAFRIPKVIQTSLIAYAYFARFDNTGHYIAIARSDCAAVIWDLDTLSEVRVLEGHVGLITDISWSRNSRYVLTASKDWNCIVWDLASELHPPQRYRTIRFDVPVSRAIFHPKNCQIILVLLVTGEAYVIDCRPGYQYRSELCEPMNGDNGNTNGRSRVSTISCIDFHPVGRLIFAGTQSHILVFNTRTKRLIARHSTLNTGSIKHLKVSRCGRYLLINSTDRVIRHFEIPVYPVPINSEVGILEQDLEPIYRFADPVDKVSWNAIGYSSDTEWVIGGAADAAKHKIYVWDLSQEGILYETLEGGREPLVDVQWHPTKVAMASTTNRGTVLLWHCPTLEKWSAFAGDFEELDENVEYVEREDEFDIENEEELIARKRRAEEADVDICGSDEEVPDFYTRNINKGWEDDLRWAEEHPDEDLPNWIMRFISRDDPQ